MKNAPDKFSEAEIAALGFLRERGGSILVTAIPEKNGKGIFNDVVPGIRVYQRLEARGFLVITEEEPQEDMGGFCFTPSVELTDSGLAAAERACCN